MGVLISLNQLEPDKYITDAVIYDYDEKTPLIKNGVLLTAGLIRELKKKYLIDGKEKSCFVNVRLKNFVPKDEENLKNLKNEANTYLKVDADIPEFVDLTTKITTLSFVKNAYQQSEKQLEQTLNMIKKCISKISYQTQGNSKFTYSLGQYKDINNDEEQYAHSFRVAQFAVTLANIYNQNLPSKDRINLEDIGTAALLHEFGTRFKDEKEMNYLSQSTLNKDLVQKYPIPASLLQQPYNEKAHSIYSYIALSNHLPPTTRLMILLGNVSDNSSFYKNTKIGPSVIAAKIIFLCNIYDILLRQVITGKSKFTLEDIRDCMDRNAQLGIINEDLKNLFFDNIPLYSTGVRVKLSTGEYGIIVGNHPGRNNITRPIVKVLETGKTIDLLNSENRNITILEVVGKHEELSDKLDMNKVINADKIEIMNDYTNSQLKSTGVFLPDEIFDINDKFEQENKKAM